MPIDPAGIAGPTRGQAAGPKWRRTSQGCHVPTTVGADLPEQRILEQSVRLPAGGAVTGWASCRLSTANFFDGLKADRRTKMPIPLAIGTMRNIRGDAEATVSRERLDPSEVVIRYGIACTRERRALFDEMRRVRDWREAVVAMDMMAAARLVSIAQMREYCASHAAWKRVRQVSRALDFASERSRSPNETRMRLIWQVDAGFPRPLVNQPVFTLDGKLLGIPDILDPVAGVVGEFDGADHRGATRHSKDVGREDGFRRRGLEFFRVTGLDLPNRPLVVGRMESSRSRGRWVPEGQRQWTIVAPPGWDREESLDELFERRAWLNMVHEQGDPDVQDLIDL